MKKIIVVRGISGCGKSSYIRNHHPNALVCSADDYFIQVLGNGHRYAFDARKLGDAHKWCIQKFLKAVFEDVEEIAVDNTNISCHEISPYVSVAEAMNYEVQIIRIEADPKVCAERNIHGVPEKSIIRMARRIEGLPKYWKETVIKN